MVYRLRIAPIAQRQIDDFVRYIRDYGDDLATYHVQRLNEALSLRVQASPLRWSYLPLTGPPFRGYLFRVGRRTQYWIVYQVFEEIEIVDVLRFWNVARDPEGLSLG